MQASAPYYVNWNYTYACNLRCTHCYSRAPQYPRELSDKDYLKIADQIIESGVFAVGFGGGEPTLRKDLISIISKLGLAGLETHLTTNGWFINEDYLNQLKQAELSKILISLDSHIEQKNDIIRNSKDSYKKSVNAIQIAKKADLKPIVAVVISLQNFNELDEIVNFAESIGASGVNFKIYRPVGNGKLNEDMHLLQNENKLKITDAINKLKTNSKIEISSYQDTESINGGCSCGITQLTIRPNGDIAACPYSDNILGNLTEQNLTDIWNNNKILVNRRNGDNRCIGNTAKLFPSNSNFLVKQS